MTADPIDTKRKIMKQNERSMPINVQLEWTDSLKIINYKNRNKKKKGKCEQPNIFKKFNW